MSIEIVPAEAGRVEEYDGRLRNLMHTTGATIRDYQAPKFFQIRLAFAFDDCARL
ncbi:MAG: hypothetical protein AAF384_07565 [Pseudomonadota bacterium]